MPEHADALRRLYESNARELYAYALSLTGHVHTAEDAVHGAMARVLARWLPPRELRPYLFRCVRNAALDAARRNGVAARNAHFLVPLDIPDQRVPHRGMIQ
jgi:RNA polymerase sigma factor (sigma-70 family)